MSHGHRKKLWFRKKYEHEMILSRHQEPGPFPYVLVLDGLKPGFNIGKILRTANALGCREVHFAGIGMFDPSPAKGALKQTKTRSFANVAESLQALVDEGYTIYALDPLGEAVLGKTEFPEKSAFVMGHEEYGLSFKFEDWPMVRRLRIVQFGSVQSLNVSIAASLACFEYLRQRNFEGALKD